jgi:hypothetical protein
MYSIVSYIRTEMTHMPYTETKNSYEFRHCKKGYRFSCIQPAGDGKIANLFLQCRKFGRNRVLSNIEEKICKDLEKSVLQS